MGSERRQHNGSWFIDKRFLLKSLCTLMINYSKLQEHFKLAIHVVVQIMNLKYQKKVPMLLILKSTLNTEKKNKRLVSCRCRA